MTEAAGAGSALEALDRFYRFHARIYDATRPFLLFGRDAVVDGLAVAPGLRVIDVGCGTGRNLPRLAGSGAEVLGFEPSTAMRLRAGRRAARLPRVRIEARPFGPDAAAGAWAERVLFSYSLSMIPPWREVLEAALETLVPGGRIGVVDFLDAWEPLTRAALTASHVSLGPERLEALRQLFPRHRSVVRRGLTWRYFLFWGEKG